MILDNTIMHFAESVSKTFSISYTLYRYQDSSPTIWDSVIDC